MNPFFSQPPPIPEEIQEMIEHGYRDFEYIVYPFDGVGDGFAHNVPAQAQLAAIHPFNSALYFVYVIRRPSEGEQQLDEWYKAYKEAQEAEVYAATTRAMESAGNGMDDEDDDNPFLSLVGDNDE